jgi:hypothetical protein
MLQAHSWLWHYLWVAPNILLLLLAALLWRRRGYKLYPAFVAFAFVGAVAELISYAADIATWVDPIAWWRVHWTCLMVEGLLKFAVVAEIFSLTLHDYSAIARLGRVLISGLGALLIFTGAIAAAVAPHDSRYGIIYGAHLLEQSIFLVETGLLVFVFLFAYYFRLRMKRAVFGISFGLAISACVHLAFWGLIANTTLPNPTRYRLEFVPMGTYHFIVLLWSYYLLVPHKVSAEPPPVLPDHNLALWNRELERLLKQ